MAARQASGWRIDVVEPAPEATATRQRIAAVASESSQVHILLAGDAPSLSDSPLAASDHHIRSPLVPTFTIESVALSSMGFDEEYCTDWPYGDLDGDGDSQAAVGRICARTPEQLRSMLARSLAFESRGSGDWQYRMQLTAGIGGFSPLADMAIEAFTRTLLTQALPPAVDLQVTQAASSSFYFPSLRGFHAATIQSLQQPGLLWVYTGHGWYDQLDRVGTIQQHYPILEAADAARLSANPAPPVAALFACYSGAFDWDKPCLAESMLAAPHGPVAVLAASRTSMPYGLGTLAMRLLPRTYAADPQTLGQLVAGAKTSVATIDEQSQGQLDRLLAAMATALSPTGHDLAAERLEHLGLVNLLGDPTMSLPSFSSLPVSAQVDTGQITVSGVAPTAGDLVVETRRVRGSVSRQLRQVQPTSDADYQHRHQLANDSLLASHRIAVTAGDFRVALPLPDADVRTACVRVLLTTEGQSHWGCQTIALPR